MSFKDADFCSPDDKASTSLISATTDSTAADEITLDVRIEENVHAPTEGMKLTNIIVFSLHLLIGHVDD